jgi:hypothetical protein
MLVVDGKVALKLPFDAVAQRRQRHGELVLVQPILLHPALHVSDLGEAQGRATPILQVVASLLHGQTYQLSGLRKGS